MRAFQQLALGLAILVLLGQGPLIAQSNGEPHSQTQLSTELEQHLAAAKSEDAQVRRAAVKELCQHEQLEAVRLALLIAKFDTDAGVRESAYGATPPEDRAAALDVLVEQLHSPRNTIPFKVAGSLKSYSDDDLYQTNWEKYESRFAKSDPIRRGLLALGLCVDQPEVAAVVPLVLQKTPEDDILRHYFFLFPLDRSEELDARVTAALHAAMQSDDLHFRRVAPILYRNNVWDPPAKVLVTLRNLLRDEDPAVRRNAILACGVGWRTDPDEIALKALTETRFDKDDQVRRACFQTIGFTFSEEMLIAGLHDRNPVVRVTAALLLGNKLSQGIEVDPVIKKFFRSVGAGEDPQRDPKVVAHLKALAEKLSRDPDPAVRGLTALGIVRKLCGQQDKYPELKFAVPVVMKAMEIVTEHPLPVAESPRYGHIEPRHRMIRLLGTIGPAAAGQIPFLLEELGKQESLPTSLAYQNQSPTDTTAAVQAALIGIGKPAIPELKKQFANENTNVRITAAIAAINIDGGCKEAVPVLLESLKGDCWGTCSGGFFYRADIEALRRCDATTLPMFWEFARDKKTKKETFGRLRMAMVYMHDPAAIPILTESLKDSHIRVRLLAIEGLGSYWRKADEVIPVLKKLENDPSRKIRKAAKAAITRIESNANWGLSEEFDFGKTF